MVSDYMLILDLQQFAGEKTEKATPKKRQEARKKGQVAKSNEINTAIVLLFAFLILKFFGAYMARGVIDLFIYSLSELMLWTPTVESIQLLSTELMFRIVLIIFPVMLGSIIAGVSANLGQVGFMFTTEPLQFKLSNINPLSGLKRMFSSRSLVELVKSIFKISVIGFVAYLTIMAEKEVLFTLNHFSVFEIASVVAGLSIEIGWRVALILLVMSAPDYVFQRYQHEKSIRMSKQDIKDEHKRSEGDPRVKGKRQQIQRRMALQRMMSDVPKADVIITNPTHYSIAIQYDGETMDAPVILAKGLDHTALRIREIAEEYNIPMVENRPLAQTLYRTLDIGDFVPEQLFQAVAEILAYVYKLKGKV